MLRRNPCHGAELPDLPHTEMRTLDVEQTKALLTATAGHRLEALFWLAINRGLRQGELLGLKWSDVNWDTGTLQIQRQLQRLPGEGLQLVGLKTDKSRRSVALGTTELAKLKEHRRKQLEERLFYGKQWVDQDLIFTNTKGGPCTPRNSTNSSATFWFQ